MRAEQPRAVGVFSAVLHLPYAPVPFSTHAMRRFDRIVVLLPRMRCKEVAQLRKEAAPAKNGQDGESCAMKGCPKNGFGRA